MRRLGQPNRQLIRLCRCRPAPQRALPLISPTKGYSNYSSSASNVSPYNTSDSHMDFAAIRAEMLARPAQMHIDLVDSMKTRLLTRALSDFLPEVCLPKLEMPQNVVDPRAHGKKTPSLLLGHHLVYFPLDLSGSQLSPDGTDPYHSPRGTPFTRRMWAGGTMRAHRDLKLDGKGVICIEKIRDVQVRGPAGSEKIFVDVERTYIRLSRETPSAKSGSGRTRNPLETQSPSPHLVIEECRTLVFMREPSAEEKKINLEKEQKILRSPLKPTYSVTLTPTPTLLFHYSALSYNAHRIHLDRSYCREVEGYRDLLVHGPLSLTLMLSVLSSQLHNSDTHKGVINSVDYRHLAPLYVNQPMRVCCAPRSGNVQEEWDIWVENQDGGLCVKGTVVIENFHRNFGKKLNLNNPE